jgi:hypothetical protein
MTDRLAVLRIPPHVGVMLGVSTAAYAVTLAGVTGLQANSETALIAERAPAIARIDGLTARNQQLIDALVAAGATYDAASASYAAAGDRLTALEAALTDLAASVERIDGVSRLLPSSIALPKMSRPSVGGVPTTSATTGASGVK